MFELPAVNLPQLDMLDPVRESQEELKKAVLASQHETFEACSRSKHFSESITDSKAHEESAKLQEEEELRRSKTGGAALATENGEEDGINYSSAAATPKGALPRMTNLTAEMIENHDFFAEQ